jgi:hypothetical protein
MKIHFWNRVESILLYTYNDWKPVYREKKLNMKKAFVSTWRQNSGIIYSQLSDGLLSGLL